MSLRLDFTASDRPEAQAACARLKSLYGSAQSPDVVVALGGDGFLLQTVHRYLKDGIPIFGMNRGSVGFLLNEFSEHNLMERILKSESTLISPLRMTAKTRAGTEQTALAFNEVSLLRQSHQGRQAAHPDRRHGAAGRADVRRRAGLHPPPARPPITCRRTARSSR